MIMIKKLISSILLIITLFMAVPVGPISKAVSDIIVSSKTIAANENVTTIDLTDLAEGKDADHNPIYVRKNDAINHWDECWICGDKQNIASHTSITTGTKGCKGSLGVQTKYCTICGYTEQIEKDKHNPSEWRPSATNGVHAKVCTLCGDWVGMEECKDAQGNYIGCRAGKRGTCATCNYTYEGDRHGRIHAGKCYICGVELATWTTSTEIKADGVTTVITYTITPKPGVYISTSNPYIGTCSGTLPDAWTYTLVSVSPQNTLTNGRITVVGSYKSNNTASPNLVESHIWFQSPYEVRNPSTNQLIAKGDSAHFTGSSLKADNNIPVRSSITSSGNGTASKYSTKATVTASFTDTWGSTYALVQMRLFDKDAQTVISDWKAANKSGTTYTAVFDVAAEIREASNVYVQARDVVGNITNISDGAVQVQYIDALAPRLTNVTGNSNTWAKSKQITYEAVDKGVGRNKNWF